jgi:hypothetical protein
MAAGPVFPAFLKFEHQADGSAKASFLAEVASMTGGAERHFKKSFDEIGRTIDRSLSSLKAGSLNLSFDVPGLRKTAADAEFAAQRITAMRDAAVSLAAKTGDTSAATQTYLAALRAQVIEAERARNAANEQVTTYTRLQGEIDKTVSANQRLAQSYRDTFMEQAKAANYATTFQNAINSKYAPGLDRTPRSARDSASVFESQSYAPKADTRSGLDRMLAGSASLDRAAIAATTLEQVLGRVAVKGQEVSTAIAASAEQATRASNEQAAALARVAQESERYAASAAQLRAQLDPSLAAQQRFDAEMARADDLLRAGAISAKEYAAAQNLARSNLQTSWAALTAAHDAQAAAAKRGTDANHMVVNSMRAQRVAGIQAGQQIQDMAIQFQMGTRASTIFAQQLPQLGFALTGLEGNANKTLDRIGRFGAFMSGPWGAAILIATVALSPLIDELFKTGDEADKANKKTYDFSTGLNILALSANQTANAMQQLQQEMRNAIAVQGDFLRSKALIAGQSVTDLEGRIASAQSELARLQSDGKSLTSLLPFQGPNYRRMGELQAQIKTDRESLRIAQQTATDSSIAVSQNRAIESLDKRAAATGRYNRAVAELNDTFRSQQNNLDPLAPRMSQSEYERRFTALTAKRDSDLEALQSTKRGAKGPGPIKQAQQLQRFGESAAEAIKRINERFDEQPRLVDRAAQSTRELDAIIADLSERKPAGFEQMIADAEKAKGVIQEALVRPFAEMERDAARRVQVQSLILSGRDAEAEAVQRIWQFEERLGPLSEERKAQIYAIAQAEEQVNEVLRKRQEIQNAYLDATRSVRSELEKLFSGESVNFGAIFRQLKSRVIVENLFGDVLRDMDKYIRRSTGVDDAVDMLKSETERAGKAASVLADALSGAAARISSPGTALGTGVVADAAPTVTQSLEAAFDAAFAGRIAANDNSGTDEIVVTASRAAIAGLRDSGTVMSLTPEAFFERMTKGLTQPLTDELQQLLGKNLGSQLGGMLSGALYGQAVGGTPGAILGALKDIKGLPEGISGALDKALKGSSTGTAVAGVANSLGISMNQTGSQIGAAIGSFLPIPGGEIIGAIAGGIIGNLIAGIPRGRATVSNDSVSASGNRGSIIEGLNAQGSSIQSGISSIAQRLGATLGQYSVGIGAYKGGYYQVSSNVNDPYLGRSQYSAKSPYAVYDGLDATAALKAAIGVAVQQGALVGLRASTQALLKAGKDIEVQVDKALQFEGVFTSLKEATDPLGAALDTLNKKFSALKVIFAEASATTAEYADLEKLYGIERAKLIEQEKERLTSTLKRFLDDLKVGNNGLSLTDRRSAALAAYDPLKQRVLAGDSTAFDPFASAGQTLLEIERELYGSSKAYFDRFTELTSVTQAALDQSYAMIDAAASSDSPFTASTQAASTDSTAVVSAISTQTDALVAQLAAVNANLGTLIQQGQTPANDSLLSDFALAANNW